jgi:uncharacterized membrane protein YhiD involved in acid resistance
LLTVLKERGLRSKASINSAGASRVVQAVLTGIGFLGAGVIVRRNTGSPVLRMDDR